MEQEKFEIWMMEYLSGELNQDQKLAFEKHIKNHPGRKEEFDAMSATWSQIDTAKVPEPSQEMDTAFFDMLHSEIEKKENKGISFIAKLKSFFEAIQKPQLAFGMLLLGIGLIAGYFMKSDANAIQTNTVSVSDTNIDATADNETEALRGQLVLTLLDQTSANKRLQGVNEAAKLNDANELVIKALFTTLNNDVNINVRLVAVESLAKYVETPDVRMGLVKSIALQDSPLVQIALADLMVALQEKTSIESMKQLLEKPDIDNTVKQKLEESINHII